MKLVANRGREDSDKIVRVDRQSGAPDYTWLSVWWEPTEEDYLDRSGKRTRSYRGGERGFPQLVSSFIPEGSICYADLSPIYRGERPAMIIDLEERRFRYEIPGQSGRVGKTEPEKVKRKHWWTGLFMRERRDGPLYAEVDRDFVALAFKSYGSWQSDMWTFLVCRKPLPNWVEHLHELTRTRFVSKELLKGIELVLTNRWEHGLELLSSSLSYEQLLEMAKEACSKLKWQLEIRST
jgi:hypothetical protein